MQGIEEIVEILDSEGLHPVRVGDRPFQRNINFHLNGVEYWISWWANEAWLSIGGRYTCYIPFDEMGVNKTWPCYKRGLQFTLKGEYTCLVAINFLDWQWKQ